MEAVKPATMRDVLLLSLTAGSADAIGYLGLGQVFTSNMTGNVVLLGIHLGQGHLAEAVRTFYVLAVFFLGLCLGAWLGGDPAAGKGAPGRILAVEKIVLLIFALAWAVVGDASHGIVSHALLAWMALAMSLQSMALQRLSAPGVATTAVTGTMAAFAAGFTHLLALARSDATRATVRERVGFQLGVLFLYCSGAALSGMLIIHWRLAAGFLPILATAFVGRKAGGPNPSP